MAQFDAKIFNPEVFGKYVDRIPKVRQNKLLQSGILRTRNELETLLGAQSGGNYVTLPMKGLIDGSPLNYDGSTDITATSTKTYSQSMIVVGRAKAWKELDFSSDITGEDFMDNVAAQVSTYWDDVDQDTLLSILRGIFKMGANDFTIKHTTDITGDATPTVGATTLNTSIQKAGGDNKDIFKLVITHSAVATSLENLSAIQYLKYTDSKGVERDLGLATWNGRLLLIDDSVPCETVSSGNGTQGVYTLTVSAAAAEGDKISFDGIEYVTVASGATGNQLNAGAASSVCTQLQALLGTQYDGVFTVTKTASTVVLSQASNGYGAVPSVTVTQGDSGTLAAAMAVTTAGAAPSDTVKYTTYVLGEGAFDFCDVGAKKPYEMDRDPSAHGGEDVLYTRQRKCFAPFGISFTKNSMASLSPTSAELETGSNWELVNDGAASGTTYINHKAIPIVRIISEG